MRLKRKKTMFIHTNSLLITSFYIKKVPIFAELALSQRWSAIFCATGVWGGKPIGRVRVELKFLSKIYQIKLNRNCPTVFISQLILLPEGELWTYPIASTTWTAISVLWANENSWNSGVSINCRRSPQVPSSVIMTVIFPAIQYPNNCVILGLGCNIFKFSNPCRTLKKFIRKHI